MEKVGRDLDIPGVAYGRPRSVQLIFQEGAVYEVPCGCITSSQGETAGVVAKLNIALPSKPDGEGRLYSDDDVDDDGGSECSYNDSWDHSPLGYSYTPS